MFQGYFCDFHWPLGFHSQTLQKAQAGQYHHNQAQKRKSALPQPAPQTRDGSSGHLKGRANSNKHLRNWTKLRGAKYGSPDFSLLRQGQDEATRFQL